MPGLGPGGSDRWRYRFYQMQNGQPGYTTESFLFDLPLNSMTFTTQLQQTGRWSGTLQLTDPGVRDLVENNPMHMLCDRTAMYVELNGELVYGGILQQTSYDSDSKQVRLNGQDWWGYFSRCRIISWNANYTGADQAAVASDLMNIAQGAASSTSFTGHQTPAIAAGYCVGGDVGVDLGPIAAQAIAGTYSTGVAVTQSWAQSSFKNLGQAVSDLGTSADGFDWTIDVAYDANGNPTKLFNIWFPRAGRTQAQQIAAGYSIVIDMGSASGQKYIWPAGQTQTANVMFGAGSGASNTAIASQASAPEMVDEGWPLLEQSVSYTDLISQTLLDQVTLANLYPVEVPVAQPSIQYACGSNSDLPLGTYAIGDDVRLIIPPDAYFPKGYDSSGNGYGEQDWRIQQVQVTVKDEGLSNQTITLCTPPVIP